MWLLKIPACNGCLCCCGWTWSSGNYSKLSFGRFLSNLVPILNDKSLSSFQIVVTLHNFLVTRPASSPTPSAASPPWCSQLFTANCAVKARSSIFEIPGFPSDSLWAPPREMIATLFLRNIPLQHRTDSRFSQPFSGITPHLNFITAAGTHFPTITWLQLQSISTPSKSGDT